MDAEDKNIFCPRKKRLEALGPLISDPILDKLAAEAETLFIPKRVLSKDDWLASRKELGQTYPKYKMGSPDINWINARFKTIVLVMLDDTVPPEMQAGLELYCSAFFTGCDVKIKRPGEMWQNKALPSDFCKANNITERGDQVNATEIIDALEPLRKKDTFCILGVTNKDLYPDDTYNYVFGLARLTGAGVFSFCRYAPTWPGNEHDQGNWTKRAVHTMAHEITHMFGMKHCIYYECLMNGTMSAEESSRKPTSILCPVCLKKLKCNIKFDTKDRFQRLLDAAQKLGLS